MKKEFFKYAIPSALAMFISSLYTVIDGIFAIWISFHVCYWRWSISF